jgi:hypothetical protein
MVTGLSGVLGAHVAGTLLAIFAARANEWRGSPHRQLRMSHQNASSTASVSATRFPLSAEQAKGKVKEAVGKVAIKLAPNKRPLGEAAVK